MQAGRGILNLRGATPLNKQKNKTMIRNILLIVLFTLTGCDELKKEKGDHVKVFDLKIIPSLSSVKLSELGFDDIEYVPLETNDQSLIQNKYSAINGYDEIIAYDDYYLIRNYETILKFGMNGAFISKIGNAGRGPGEYLSCYDVETSENGQIYILDGVKSNILCFSDLGHYIRTINLPNVHKAVKFVYFKSNFLCYSQNNLADIKNSFNYIDTNGLVINSFQNKYSFKRESSNDAFVFSYENIFYHFNNQIYKKEVYCDTVFSFDGRCFNPHKVIQVGEKLITPEIRSKTDGLNILNNYINPLKLFEFGDYLYYEFIYKYDFTNPQIFGFIGSNKNDFKALIDINEGLVNDLDGGPPITPITTNNDNCIFAMLDAIELKAYVASEAFIRSTPKYSYKKKELEKLASGLKETDNPVLIKVTLKK